MTAAPPEVSPSGDFGLDKVLHGGFRLVERLPGKLSATIVVRGGPGVGKTIYGAQIAEALARGRGGDVVVACIEILPTEYAAQLGSALAGPSDARIVLLPATPRSTTSARFFIGLLDLGDGDRDLVGAIERLCSAARASGARPSVVVVDSLIEGYGFGASFARSAVDGVMKYAAGEGICLVLCEEVTDPAPTAWVFAADTVLELGVDERNGSRWLDVRKHRFAPSAVGRHTLDLQRGLARVSPRFGAYLAAGDATGDLPALVLDLPDRTENPRGTAGVRAAFAVVQSHDSSSGRRVARALQPASDPNPLSLELDGTVMEGRSKRDTVPFAAGPTRCLAQIAARLDSAEPGTLSRVVLGDLAMTLDGSAGFEWAEAIGVLAAYLRARRPNVPLVVYATISHLAPAFVALATRAEAVVHVSPLGKDHNVLIVTRDGTDHRVV